MNQVVGSLPFRGLRKDIKRPELVLGLLQKSGLMVSGIPGLVKWSFMRGKKCPEMKAGKRETNHTVKAKHQESQLEVNV